MDKVGEAIFKEKGFELMGAQASLPAPYSSPL